MKRINHKKEQTFMVLLLLEGSEILKKGLLYFNSMIKIENQFLY